MSDIEPDYELKFRLYDGNEKKISKFISQYQEIRDKKKEEGSVMSRVLSYFFDGLTALANGDERFWGGHYNDAYLKYQEALRMLNRFQNSRNVTARLDLLAERIISRAKGLINLTDGLNTNDMSLREKLFTDALNDFNNEVNLTNKMDELISSYAAYARASFTESQLLLVASRNISGTNSDQAKRNLLKARSSLRQASFIDPRFYFANEEIERELDETTKGRLLLKAEIQADEATEKSENGLYLDAKIFFRKAMMFHKRASTLASDTGSRRKLLSSATIYEASMHEADGNQLFRRENNTMEASLKFNDAARFVDKAIALIGHFGSESLIRSFSCQSSYYKAMSLQAKAINEFDDESYSDAKEIFENSINMFSEAIETARKADNPVIISLGNEAIADVNGYLSMCEAMIK